MVGQQKKSNTCLRVWLTFSSSFPTDGAALAGSLASSKKLGKLICLNRAKPTRTVPCKPSIRDLLQFAQFFGAFMRQHGQKKDQLQRWAARHFHHSVVFGKGSASAETCAARLQNAFAKQGGFLATMDWSAAYDRMRPAVSSAVFTQLGLPPPIARLIMEAWGNQQRWVSWAPIRSSFLQAPPRRRVALWRPAACLCGSVPVSVAPKPRLAIAMLFCRLIWTTDPGIRSLGMGSLTASSSGRPGRRPSASKRLKIKFRCAPAGRCITRSSA